MAEPKGYELKIFNPKQTPHSNTSDLVRHQLIVAMGEKNKAELTRLLSTITTDQIYQYKDENQGNVFHLCVEKLNYVAWEYFFKLYQEGKINVAPTDTNKYSKTPLMYLASMPKDRYQDHDVARFVLNMIGLMKNNNGLTALGYINTRNSNDLTALHMAIEARNKNIALILVKHGADINSINTESLKQMIGMLEKSAGEGSFDKIIKNINNPIGGLALNNHSPLMLAAMNNDIEMIRSLISAGADLHLVDFENNTALDKAAAKHNMAAINELLKAGLHFKSLDVAKNTFKSIVNEQGNDINVLQLAFDQGHFYYGKELLYHGLRFKDYEGTTKYFFMAVMAAHVDTVKYFFELGLVPSIKLERKTDTGEKLNVLQLIVLKDRLVQQKEDEQSLLLHEKYMRLANWIFLSRQGSYLTVADISAIQEGTVDNSNMKKLLAQEITNRNSRLIFSAIDNFLKSGDEKALHKSIVEAAKSCKVVDERRNNYKTPLMCLMGSPHSLGNGRCIKALLELGANPDAEDQQGRTALYYLVMNGGLTYDEAHTRFYSLLSFENSYIKYRFYDGSCPIHIVAILNNNINMLQILIESGKIDINAKMENGDTALHIAAIRRDVKSTEFLLKAGAKLLTNKNNWYPLHSAVNALVKIEKDENYWQDLEKFKLITEKMKSSGQDTYGAVDIDGNTFIMLAVQIDNDDLFEYFLAINQYMVTYLKSKNSQGDTFLHIAARAPNFRVMNTIFEKMPKKGIVNSIVCQLICDKNKSNETVFHILINRLFANLDNLSCFSMDYYQYKKMLRQNDALLKTMKNLIVLENEIAKLNYVDRPAMELRRIFDVKEKEKSSYAKMLDFSAAKQILFELRVQYFLERFIENTANIEKNENALRELEIVCEKISARQNALLNGTLSFFNDGNNNSNHTVSQPAQSPDDLSEDTNLANGK